MNFARWKLALAGGLAALLAVVVTVGQLVSTEPAAPRAGAHVTVLSAHWEGIRKEFAWAFSDWLRRTEGIDAHIEYLDVGGGGSKILKHIESSFRQTPDSIGVDVVFGGGAEVFEPLARAGLLAPARLSRGVRRGIPREAGGVRICDPDGLWYSAALSGFGIVWNKPVVEKMSLPGVKTWTDLTNPRLMGWVASGDPSSSGAVRAALEIILQARGFEDGYGVLVQMAGNVAAFDEGGNAAPRAVALGQAAYGLCIDFYGAEQVAALGAESVGFILPAGQTVMTPDPIAVLKGAPQPELAHKFVDFVLSDEGQKLWYLKPGAEGGPRKYGLNRMPVRPALYDMRLPTAVTVNPFSWTGGLAFDQRLSDVRSRILIGLFRATIIDVHAELREAWAALAAAGEPPDLAAEFVRPPVSGGELLRLAAEAWPDPTLRAELQAEWSDFARRKYARVRDEARARLMPHGRAAPRRARPSARLSACDSTHRQAAARAGAPSPAGSPAGR